jgi:translation initiation factor IF-2
VGAEGRVVRGREHRRRLPDPGLAGAAGQCARPGKTPARRDRPGAAVPRAGRRAVRAGPGQRPPRVRAPGRPGAADRGTGRTGRVRRPHGASPRAGPSGHRFGAVPEPLVHRRGQPDVRGRPVDVRGAAAAPALLPAGPWGQRADRGTADGPAGGGLPAAADRGRAAHRPDRPAPGGAGRNDPGRAGHGAVRAGLGAHERGTAERGPAGPGGRSGRGHHRGDGGAFTGLAAAFDRTFWWAIAFTAAGALPALLLRRPAPPPAEPPRA